MLKNTQDIFNTFIEKGKNTYDINADKSPINMKETSLNLSH